MNYASSGYLFMIIVRVSGLTSLFSSSVPMILSTTHPPSVHVLHSQKWYIKRSFSLLLPASGLVLYLSFSFFHILNLFLDAKSISWAYKHTKFSPILKAIKTSISSSPSLSKNNQIKGIFLWEFLIFLGPLFFFFTHIGVFERLIFLLNALPSMSDCILLILNKEAKN